MAEQHHHHHLFHHHKEDEQTMDTAGTEVDYKKEEKHHKHLEQLGEMGAVAAGAYALHEKHKAKKDPEHAHKHKIEEEVAAPSVPEDLPSMSTMRRKSQRKTSPSWAAVPSQEATPSRRYHRATTKALRSMAIESTTQPYPWI
ncbi:hypothetical protein AHAS_Ahas05G0304100 [Arachis hypogaea]